MDSLLPRERVEVAPGAVLVPGWLDPDRQHELLAACRAWARPPAGLRRTRLPGGGVMSVRTVCLGWHWQDYRYSRTVDGVPVKPFPAWLADLGRAAVLAAYSPGGAGAGRTAEPGQGANGADSGGAAGPGSGDGEGGAAAGRYRPDIALVNFYDDNARMGLHQDKDERSPAPVVSLSLGDTGLFRFGNTESRRRPWTDIPLESGDLFVFGGPSRLAYHGVTRVLPGTAPVWLGLRGRLNITLRESGLP
ncbi:alpha-ketoglutarate-dependent dioxygenase AlkB [Bailinhaonella thermotolerans]|uniref:Alpha-ketoglutarate-dependent dioxygenase AlkB n=2 Tax=Bailinhaonella thermotolerans TaxID=1070861 RepID=A0A3A4A9R2_9ACTN|nr:alpha-ketoglutarate-dependent dioxygenase AlkB [Bailinhaonella thermotolerans]RJL23064.1 alpha-ketoglutarate-dependent dioxygenase AlkB [Bailinhaonella thermotolerans]